MCRKTYIKLILLLMLKETLVAPSIICRNGGKYKKSNCENIYIWNRHRNDFISLFNVSFFSNDSDIGAIQGKTVRVIADNMLPYVTSSNYSQHLGGFLGDIWKAIEDNLKFTTNIKSIFYDTGLKIITSGEADIMLAAVVVKKDLINIKYSQPYFYNSYYLFSRQPELQHSSSSYIRIFETKLWFSVLIMFLTLTLALWLTIRCLNSTYHHLEPNISIPSCFMVIISGFINQDFNVKFASYAGRIQIIFALILGVVLYSALNAVLVAQLSVFDTSFIFTSLEDTDENRDLLPRWKNIVNGPNCLDINNQTNLAKILCKKNIVALESQVVMNTILKHYKIPCKISYLNKKYFEKGNSFLMWKGFKYRAIIDKIMDRMKSSGILKRLENKWIKQKNFNDVSTILPQATLGHIKGVLYMYAAIVLISLFILIIEMLFYQYTRRDKTKHILT